jgi:hypothetical protein
MTLHSQARTHPPVRVAARAPRFSEGIERTPLAPSSSRVGCFGDGAGGPRSDSAKRTGSFADGLAHQPRAASATRIGSFSDVEAARLRGLGGSLIAAAASPAARPTARGSGRGGSAL